MLGHLVPCGGGRTIPLPKARLVIGPRRRPGDASGSGTCHAELVFADGFWSVRRIGDGLPICINDAPRESGRLMPEDVLSVGRCRYRVVYSPPGALVGPPAHGEQGRAAAAAAGELLILGLLVPCGGGPAVPLRKRKIIVGRASTCDVVLPQRVVSSWHCALQFVDGFWRMIDLDSNNGTSVDGMHYREKWLLPGNILGVATHRFRMEYRAHGDRPPSTDDVAVLPKQSLMQRAGLTGDRLDKMLAAEEDIAGPPHPLWLLDEDSDDSESPRANRACRG